MPWLNELFSGDNSKRDIKAYSGGIVVGLGMLVYLAYAAKGFFIQGWDMPEGVKTITVNLILGGLGLTASTVFNQKLGVSPPPDCGTTPPMPEPPKTAGPVG